MKLYATTTSERASKGQGGNEIHFTLQDEKEAMVMEMHIEYQKGNIIVKDFWTGDMNTKEIENYYTKGKKQKTATCTYCNRPATKERGGYELVCDKH